MNSVKWGEYKLGELFEIASYKKRFDANKVHLTKGKGYPYIVRQEGNNGQKGYIVQDERYLNDANTISFGQDTATMYYQKKPYFTGDKIKILKAKNSALKKENAQFFLASMNVAFNKFSWGAISFSVNVIQEQKIHLPVTDNRIDFDFMENFIAELEKGYINKLWRYLDDTVPDGCCLTDAEKDALQKNVVWEKFTFRSIFDHIKQGRRLKKEDQLPGTVPFVMAGTTNNGVANYVANPVATFPANSITVDIFGNTFYRNYPFGAGDDTGVYWSEKKTYSLNTMLFLAAAMQTAVKGKFSYGHKLRSSQSLSLSMSLPIADGEPDFTYMDNYISAVKKILLADVVRYVAEKTNNL